MFRELPRTVFVLGLVSFFTDVSSEMIYPLLPIFLSTILGVGAVELGFIEGVAETTAAMLKLFSGIWTDQSGKRKPLVLLGYSLSGLARPFVGLTTVWQGVLVLRFLDRIGKGIRTSPRDAMIADITTETTRGRAYGFHRSMDHAGAVGGPLMATLMMVGFGVPLRQVFLWAAVPALIAVIVIFFGLIESEKPQLVQKKSGAFSPKGFRLLSKEFRYFLLAMLVFSLGNATDAFLLLKLADVGVPVGYVALLWSLHHVVKMGASLLGGRLADYFGPRRMIFVGLIIYALVYAGFAFLQDRTSVVLLFLAYGLYYGCAEPSERAYVSLLVPADKRGTAFGWFHFTVGLAALPASVIFGLVWKAAGSTAAFEMGAGFSALAAVLFLIFRPVPTDKLVCNQR